MPEGHSPILKNLQERRLLKGLYAGVLVLLLLLLLATFRTFDHYSRTNRNIRQSNAVLHEVEAMASALKDALIGVRGFILTHDTSYVLPFRIAQPAVEHSIRRLDSLTNAGATDLDYGPLKSGARQLLKVIQEQFLSERSSSIGLQGNEAEQLRNGRDLMERVRAEQHRLVGRTERLRDEDLVAERSLQPDTPLMLLIYSGLALLFTGILFWRLFRALDKAENAEMETMRKVELLNKEVRTREFAERSLKRVLDSSPSAIMAFRSVRDRLGQLVDLEWILANQESERMLGRPAGGLVGKKLLEEFPEQRGSETFKAYQQVVETGVPFDAELHMYGPEGWTRVHALRLLDGLVATLTDVSETKRVKDLLAEGDRLATTGGIARTIAHEVRNPLTNLSMALEQLLEEVGPEHKEDVAPFAEILDRNIRRIGKLITDLLESSKAKELHLRSCDTGSLLREALGNVQDRLDLLEIKAVVEVPEGTSSVMADPEMIDVALTNLCINAIEAMTPGEGVLRLSAQGGRGNVRICIEDNGKGISPENIPHLFRAFYSGRSGGMGLGLTSARSILNAHGVHMNVESEPGKGTRFTLTFPE